MDLRLDNGSVMQVVGPSGCGKTRFVSQLIQTKGIYKHDHKNIYWHMGVGLNEEGTELPSNVIIRQGFEDKDWMDKLKKYDVVVIDDLFTEVNKEQNFNNLFTKVARHRQVSVIFITQNMFHQGGNHRTRNINVHYLVLFKNPRDKTTISWIARQAYPENPKFLIEAYHDATDNKPHGYLFIDFTQECPESMRVRSDIFTDMTVYINKHTSKPMIDK